MKKEIIRRDFDAKDGQFSPSIDPLLQRIYGARGVVNDDQLDNSLRQLMNYRPLHGLNAAVVLLAEAIEQQQRILIVGDFDCDGATSTSLAVLALKRFGARFVDYLVPNRFDFGYGLTPQLVHHAADKSPELIVTVDNGISSHQGVDAARDLGIKVLVTDHHLPGQTLPQAEAIVNPNQPDCRFMAKSTAGVGVIYYVMLALRAYLCEQAWYRQGKVNMAELLDLVALGTVADVVPLEHNNRILVAQGIARIKAGRARPGILALLEIAGKDYRQLVSSDLGFIVGPRLNAAGRLEDMSAGIECLLAEDLDHARALAIELDRLNHERKYIEKNMQREALQTLETVSVDQERMPHAICLHQQDWHQGVIGILASRIKDRYNRPVIAFAQDNDTELKGSARSIPGFHMRDALAWIDAQAPGMITKFGGHAMAAGLTIQRSMQAEFAKYLNNYAEETLDKEALSAKIYTDGSLDDSELTEQTASLLANAGPWGQHFPEPSFDGEFVLVDYRVLKEKHIKMVISTPFSSNYYDALIFNADVEDWSKSIKRLHLVYKPQLNHFRGNTQLQLLVDYYEFL